MSERPQIIVDPKSIVVSVLDKTSPTIQIKPDATYVTVDASEKPVVQVILGGGRGPLFAPETESYWDGTGLAAVLSGAITRQQLSQDLVAEIDATTTGLEEARADLNAALLNFTLTGEFMDTTVSRLDIAEDNITAQVSRLDAAELNISHSQLALDDKEVRLTVAEQSVTNHENFIVAQERLLKNEWTIKIQENIDGSACVAGTGLLMYPNWALSQVYDEDEFVWFSDGAYKSKVIHSSTIENAPPNTDYWEYIPFATKSQFGVLADSFFVQTSVDGDKAVPFMVYGDQVIIHGDMIVNGLISANAISTNHFWSWTVASPNYVPGVSGYKLDATTGKAEFNDFTMIINYGDISGAPNSLEQIDTAAANKLGGIAAGADKTQTAINATIDTSTGGLIVRNTAALQYAHLTGGDLTFYDYYGGSYKPTRSVKQIATGICETGTTVNIGYFREEPQIILSPHSLESYRAAYKEQDQKFFLQASNIRRSGNDWLFDTVCQLQLAGGSGSPGGDTQATGSFTAPDPKNSHPGLPSGTVSLLSSSISLPANVRSVSATIATARWARYPGGANHDLSEWYWSECIVTATVYLRYYAAGAWRNSPAQTFEGYCPVEQVTNRNFSITYGSDITAIRAYAVLTCKDPRYQRDSNNHVMKVQGPLQHHLTQRSRIWQSSYGMAATVISVAGKANYMAIG